MADFWGRWGAAARCLAAAGRCWGIAVTLLGSRRASSAMPGLLDGTCKSDAYKEARITWARITRVRKVFVVGSHRLSIRSFLEAIVGDVATRFWQRVSVDMQRNMHRALVRRVARNAGGADGLGRLVEGVALLEEPGL